MGVVQQAVADGVGQSGVRQVVVPELRFELAGDDGRPGAVSVFEYLQEVAALRVGHGGDGEVVDDEHVDARELGEQTWIGAVGASKLQLVEEAGGAAVQRTEALSTRLMSEGACEV